jgi:hypothetical protein
MTEKLTERQLEDIVCELARKHVGGTYDIKVRHELPYHVQIEPTGEYSKRPFQTDVCVLEGEFPRVIIELKIDVHTHDVITYSSKAVMHKRVFPYLRYGLLFVRTPTIPQKVFWHNEGFDFCIAGGAMTRTKLGQVLGDVLTEEIAASKMLENLGGTPGQASVYRRSVAIGR